eukprot:3082294-Amphidinium_carterae.1
MKAFKVCDGDLDIVKEALSAEDVNIEGLIRSTNNATLEELNDTNTKHKKSGYTATVARAML